MKGEVFVSVFGDQDVVFDADADALEGIGGGDVVVGVKVEAGFDGEDHAGAEDAGAALGVVVSASIVHIEAEPMGGTVHIEGFISACDDQFVDIAFEDAQSDETFGESA